MKLRSFAPFLVALGGAACSLVILGCAGPPHAAHSAAAPPASCESAACIPPDVDETRRAALLFFSDTHAQLETHPELFWDAEGRTEIVPAGGYARLRTATQQIREELGGRALLIDGGDTFQGAGHAAWSEGASVLPAQRALGVDLGVPGNWEVVYGAARMRDLAEGLGYPVLAANIVDAETDAPIFPATLVREVGGIRFGFVGLSDPDVPLRQAPAYSRGLRYLDASSVVPHIAALRSHVDVVVLVAHLGLARTIAVAEQLEGVDVVLSGDTHERLLEPVRAGDALVVEPGSFASFLGRLDVVLRPGQRPELRWTLLALRADEYPEDPSMAAIVRESLAPYRSREEAVLGHVTGSLERYGVIENPADALLADAIEHATGSELALSNGFRFGHPIAAGPLRERDLWMLFPVSTRLRVGTVTGAQLRRFWEDEIDHVFATDPSRLFGGWLPRPSGMHVRFAASRPYGQRVLAIEVNGEPLDDARRYRIASCEREGDAPDALCRMRGIGEPQTLELDVHEAVRRYLRAHDPIDVAPAGRVVAEDLPARVFSQFQRR